MTTYPHRYGDTDRAVEHYATACVASAKVLRSEGLPDQAADLQAEAERARAQIHHPRRHYHRGRGHGHKVIVIKKKRYHRY